MAVRLRAILIGLALGFSAGLVASCYLLLLRHFPFLDTLRGHAEELARSEAGGSFFSPSSPRPFFEEFIFRGLVFRGMRRSLPAGWSIAGSAAVFAICHPPISVIPVFVMGVLAALGFELTGWIVTPICVHMTYNGLILLSGLLPHGGHNLH